MFILLKTFLVWPEQLKGHRSDISACGSSFSFNGCVNVCKYVLLSPRTSALHVDFCWQVRHATVIQYKVVHIAAYRVSSPAFMMSSYIWDAVPMSLIINVLLYLPMMGTKAPLKMPLSEGIHNHFFQDTGQIGTLMVLLKWFLKNDCFLKNQRVLSIKTEKNLLPTVKPMFNKICQHTFFSKGLLFFLSFLISVALFTLQTWHRKRKKRREDWGKKKETKDKSKN